MDAGGAAAAAPFVAADVTFPVVVDAAHRLSTGISAADRANTLRVLANPSSAPGHLTRPGHIVPLRAVEGGVLVRNGHTEAAIDLMQLAGLEPAAAIAEVVGDAGLVLPLHPDAWAGALDVVADRGADIRSAGRARARAFTIEHSGAALAEAYGLAFRIGR